VSCLHLRAGDTNRWTYITHGATSHAPPPHRPFVLSQLQTQKCIAYCWAHTWTRWHSFEQDQMIGISCSFLLAAFYSQVRPSAWQISTMLRSHWIGFPLVFLVFALLHFELLLVDSISYYSYIYSLIYPWHLLVLIMTFFAAVLIFLCRYCKGKGECSVFWQAKCL